MTPGWRSKVAVQVDVTPALTGHFGSKIEGAKMSEEMKPGPGRKPRRHNTPEEKIRLASRFRRDEHLETP
jgi:hypothetical protein